MRSRYICAVGAEWGLQAFWRASRSRPDGDEVWEAVTNRLSLEHALSNRSMVPVRYVFFLNWSLYVPQQVTSAERCVNFHCTDLPYGRGGHPIEHLLLEGHNQTVITAHRMTGETDAGPVYAKSGKVWIGPVGGRNQSKDEILARFIKPTAELMRFVVELEPGATPQAEPACPPWRRLTPEEYRDFWSGRTGAGQ